MVIQSSGFGVPLSRLFPNKINMFLFHTNSRAADSESGLLQNPTGFYRMSQIQHTRVRQQSNSGQILIDKISLQSIKRNIPLTNLLQ